jgi:hypothetical protein
VLPIDSFVPRDSDFILTIRDGMPLLRTPTNDGGRVPEDFLILVGVASSWSDPRFRGLMLGLMRKAAEAGHLRGIVHNSDEERLN